MPPRHPAPLFLLLLWLPWLAVAAAGQPAEVQLEPIPWPELANFEPAVATQLQQMQDLLQQTLQESTAPAQLADLFGDLGRLCHAYTLLPPAAAGYRNAMQLAPGDYRWPYYLGLLAQQEGDPETAAGHFRRTLSLAPNDPPARYRLAECYLALNRPGDAEPLLRDLLASDPNHLAARAALGEIALQRGDHARAVELLEGVLAALPAADRLHYPLGLAYRGLGQAEKAREHLARRGEVGLQPPDPLRAELETMLRGERVHLLRGHRAFAHGQYREAVAAFQQAVSAEPKSARARINLGTALAAAGYPEAAEEQLYQAISIDPENANAHFNYGVLLANRTAYQEAITQFQAAANLNPDDAGARREMADVFRRLGRHQEALEAFQQAAAANPKDEPSWLGQAQLLTQYGHYAAAVEVLEQALRELPDQGRLLAALARLRAACPDLTLRDGERALELGRKVFDARPTGSHAYTVALALAELGRCAEAAEWQQRAIELSLQSADLEPAESMRQELPRYQAGPPCRP